MPLLSSAATQSTIVSDTESRTCPDTHSRLPSKLSDIILVSMSGHIVDSVSDIIVDSVSDISWNTHMRGELEYEPPQVETSGGLVDALLDRREEPNRPEAESGAGTRYITR